MRMLRNGPETAGGSGTHGRPGRATIPTGRPDEPRALPPRSAGTGHIVAPWPAERRRRPLARRRPRPQSAVRPRHERYRPTPMRTAAMTANDLNMVTPSAAGPTIVDGRPADGLTVRRNQIIGNLFLEICYYLRHGHLELL